MHDLIEMAKGAEGALLRALDAPELQHFRDVTIHAGGESFLAHRVVLASASPILSSKLSINTHTLHIPQVSAKTWGIVQNFMYKGEYIYDKNAMNLNALVNVLECAQQLEMKSLIIASEQALIDNLATSNCCALLSIGHKHGLHHLKNLSLITLRTRREKAPHTSTTNVMKFLLLVILLAIFFVPPTSVKRKPN